MNTGNGKTVVGLMILQSCLNEGKSPAVYVVPHSCLVRQVCREAESLGVKVVTDENDYNYNNGKAILIINIHKLVNGRSVFGMRDSCNLDIGSVLLDDVHACLDRITEQFSIRISKNHQLYKELLAIFQGAWKAHCPEAYIDIIEQSDARKNAILPFWIWQNNFESIYKLLKQYENNDEENKFVYFCLPLIQDVLKTSNCIITASCIEITPKGLSINKISSFDRAERRIFMSATLVDDSVFVSTLGLMPDNIPLIITPEKSNDIGDRVMLFPKHINYNITDKEIRQKVIAVSQKHNVIVIVPSYEQAKLWDANGLQTATKDNIDKFLTVLKIENKHTGLVVFVNMYNGIDLPENACRLLVVDGLPPLNNDYNKYAQSISSSNKLVLREQIQKIEQGMGRGIRSTNDSCCIVLMGNRLADVLVRGKGIDFFSNATKEQYNLSKELWELLRSERPQPTIDEIFELAEYSFNKTPEWISRSKERISSISYKNTLVFDNTIVALRKAFDFQRIGETQKAVDILDYAINEEVDEKLKGYLLFIKADYMNLIDQSKAQEILKTARKFNSGVIVPIDGIQYEKMYNKKKQVLAMLEHLSKNLKIPNEFLVYIDVILDELAYSKSLSAYGSFENSLECVGKMLGFVSSRPDHEGTGGPDNLWGVGDGKYFVIECKSCATATTISKDYCDKLCGAVQWFKREYAEYECVPIMIHTTKNINSLASPPDNMRIITPELLEKFKKNIRGFLSRLLIVIITTTTILYTNYWMSIN
ncbi:MAG: hypothetical protein LBU73_04360 [Helicobacteraceae bacterium]|jgi:hypothetical protein|nr:hypothetical protein [Helicobacteraceae bacterium]